MHLHPLNEPQLGCAEDNTTIPDSFVVEPR